MPGQPRLFGSEIYRRSSYGGRHPLAIPRVSLMLDLVRALGWAPDGVYIEATKATPEELARFHDLAYIAAVQRAELDRRIDPEASERYHIGRNGNPVFPEVFSRPATACGATLAAVELLLRGDDAPAIIHSPAGGTHHGRRDRAAGFCYFNDVVLGILRLLDRGVARVLYVDLDAHHGDGVEDAFRDDPRVLTISVHERDRWPHSGGIADQGPSWRNLPVPAGFNDSELDFLLDKAVLPLGERFAPEVVVIQSGADALADDPMTKLALSNGSLRRAVDRVRRLAPRALVLGGGGYNPWAVARCWTGVWGTVAGVEIPDRLPAPAEQLLRAVEWRHSLARDPPERWFTTLADPPHEGPVRQEIVAVAMAALGTVQAPVLVPVLGHRQA
ncbi:MAG TPA: acetoin utilization protein AcuC [Stellaceae bacterium]|nr:acetoin utilization protein AcuC [Stellaceae bacterium]